MDEARLAAQTITSRLFCSSAPAGYGTAPRAYALLADSENPWNSKIVIGRARGRIVVAPIQAQRGKDIQNGPGPAYACGAINSFAYLSLRRWAGLTMILILYSVLRSSCVSRLLLISFLSFYTISKRRISALEIDLCTKNNQSIV